MYVRSNEINEGKMIVDKRRKIKFKEDKRMNVE